MSYRRSALGWIILTATLLSFFTACDRNRSQAVFVPIPVEHKPGRQQDKQPDEVVEDHSNGAPIRQPLTNDELLKKAMACTVRLTGRIEPVGLTTEAQGSFDGSGVILGSDADDYLYVLTVQHAVRNGIDTIEVFSVNTFPAPVTTLRNPEVVSQSESNDLAVIRVKMRNKFEFASCKLVKNPKSETLPETSHSCGCSGGETPTLLPENIVGCKRFIVADSKKNALMWITEKPQETGRSGGPLLDVNGSLLGLALGKTESKKASVGYYCHSLEISDYLIDTLPSRLVTWSELGN